MIKHIITVVMVSLFSLSAFPMDGELVAYDLPTETEVIEARKKIVERFGDQGIENSVSARQDLSDYDHIDPNNLVPNRLLENALSVFHSNKQNFRNKNYISIVDFSRRSNMARMYVINMKTGQVSRVRTAHGSGGDRDNDGYVEQLSNTPNSHMSSKGFYQVSEIYSGKYGRSIRLDGLSSTNSNARARAIVLHGADYVREANQIQGRSWGCFALAWSVKDQVVDRIAGGSLLYAEKL